MFKTAGLCLSTLLMLSVMHNSNAALLGKLRTEFIEDYQKGCLKRQRSGSHNAQVQDKVLQQYCLCAATYVADVLNNPLWLDISNGDQKLDTEMIDLASKYCSKNYGKY